MGRYKKKTFTVYGAAALPKALSVSFGDLFTPDKDYAVFPGFCDVHVHFREPGFFYKESIASGCRAAAHGGYTDVLTMPNLDPVPDSIEHIELENEIIKRDATIRAHPYGALTVGEKGAESADLEGLAAHGAAAFSDDGKGVQNVDMMRTVMLRAKALNKVIAAHCEDEGLLHGGYIHAGRYAAEHGHRGIVSESEWCPIKRDAELAKETGCRYHVCHISCRESVDIIRKAKAAGVDITCETAPHYLTLCEDDIIEDGRFKMNPPLRSADDKVALIEGVLDGTIDMIATDHAPHSAEEKARGLEKSAFGIVGLETAFPVLYTELVKTGTVPLERIVEMLTEAPRKRFGLPIPDIDRDFSVWELDAEYEIDPEGFLSKGRATPFAGKRVFGRCMLTVCGGRVVYADESLGLAEGTDV